MIKIELNNSKYSVLSNLSVIETCLHLGFYIPRFCYHENLSIAGNCRMCLVEIANAPKPVASCALPTTNGMKIFTNSPLVKKAREGILEALLLNHPLDCPICDQAGECDLQDQVKVYGGDRARFFFNKRSVEDKQCGPIIKTIMTRCIHCTRCVRFNSEISGDEFFGTLNRGSHTEIGAYGKYFYNSEISGNVIDLCPVGALTSQQYAFKTRPWKLSIIESIDLTDSLTSSVYVSVKESDIFRIFPKKNQEINDNIISDKARFSFDFNKNNRLDKYFGLQNNIRNKLNLKNSNNSYLFNNFLDLDSLQYLKQLNNIQPNFKLINEKFLKNNFYINWLNNSLNCIAESKITNCFLFSSNIRLENSIINTKLRIKQQKNNLNIFGFSCIFSETFSIEFLSFSVHQLSIILESKNILSKLFLKNKMPLFILGENILKRGLDSNFLFSFLKKIMTNTILLKVSNINTELVHFLYFSKINTKKIEQVYNIFMINLEESFFIEKFFKEKNINYFNINTHYHLKHNKNMNLIPLTTEYEQENVFCNLEGKYQKTGLILTAANKEILKLINILRIHCFFNYFEVNGSLPYLKFIKHTIKNTNFYKYLNQNKFYNFLLLEKCVHFLRVNISQYPIKIENEDYYLANKTLKESKVMQVCSQSNRKNNSNFSKSI